MTGNKTRSWGLALQANSLTSFLSLHL
jgi:hypothetical protein